jgi:hypothetical protein
MKVFHSFSLLQWKSQWTHGIYRKEPAVLSYVIDTGNTTARQYISILIRDTHSLPLLRHWYFPRCSCVSEAEDNVQTYSNLPITITTVVGERFL